MICDFRLIELLLSVNGDTANTNGLKATKAVMDGLTVVLSLSATAYLEPWQSLYLMIRSTGVGAFEVVNGSTFSVTLLGKKGNVILTSGKDRLGHNCRSPWPTAGHACIIVITNGVILAILLDCNT